MCGWSGYHTIPEPHLLGHTSGISGEIEFKWGEMEGSKKGRRRDGGRDWGGK